MATPFRLPAYEAHVPDINRLMQPINEGIDGYRKNRQQELENERQNKLLQFQEQRLGMEQGRFGMEQDRFGRDMALREQTDPLTVQGQRLGLDQTRAQIGATSANTAATYGNQRRQDEAHRAQMAQPENMTPQQRMLIAPQLGIEANTPAAAQYAYKYQPKPNTFDLGPDHTRFEVRPGASPGVSTAVPIATGGSRSKSDEAFDTEMAKGDAKQLQEMVSGYPAIQQSIGKIGVMRQLSDHIGNPGMMNTIANSQLGRAARAVGLAPEQMATIESFTAMVNQLVPAQRPPGSGTMSDKDVDLFKASLPAVAATKEGRNFILAQSEMIARYDEARAKIAQEVAARRMTRKDGMDRMMALPNPLQGLESNLKQFGIAGAGMPVQPVSGGQVQGGGIPAGAVQMLQANPSLGAAFDAKYGPGAASRVLGGGAPADGNGVPYPPASR